ncbi:MAG: glycosyltransferase family 2 protein [Candidatus Kapaibacterium sp.]
MTDKLTIVIPFYNEETALKVLIPFLQKFSEDNKCKVIMVNDGSDDNSDSIIKSFSFTDDFTLIRHKMNRGYGAALKSGIEKCETEYVITFDADGQHSLDDVIVLYNKIISEDADLVIGSRINNDNTEKTKMIGKFIIRNLSKILIQNKITDLNAGMKIMRSNLAKKYIRICPDTFSFSDVITLIFVSEKNEVIEEPVKVLPRENGKSKITLNTAFDTVMEIINITVLFNPLRVFLPLSLLFLVLGVIWSFKIVLDGKGVSVGGSLLIVLGILSLLMGLIAEQLSFIKKRLM